MYPCDQCEYVGSKINLTNHKRKKHPGTQTDSDTGTAFASNQMVYNDAGEQIYPCDQCDCVYKLPAFLQIHKHFTHPKKTRAKTKANLPVSILALENQVCFYSIKKKLIDESTSFCSAPSLILNQSFNT